MQAGAGMAGTSTGAGAGSSGLAAAPGGQPAAAWMIGQDELLAAQEQAGGMGAAVAASRACAEGQGQGHAQAAQASASASALSVSPGGTVDLLSTDEGED